MQSFLEWSIIIGSISTTAALWWHCCTSYSNTKSSGTGTSSATSIQYDHCSLTMTLFVNLSRFSILCSRSPFPGWWTQMTNFFYLKVTFWLEQREIRTGRYSSSIRSEEIPPVFLREKVQVCVTTSPLNTSWMPENLPMAWQGIQCWALDYYDYYKAGRGKHGLPLPVTKVPLSGDIILLMECILGVELESLLHSPIGCNHLGCNHLGSSALLW